MSELPYTDFVPRPRRTSEVRTLRHTYLNDTIWYSIGVVYSGGFDMRVGIPQQNSPEELRRLIDEAFSKEPVDFKPLPEF